MHALAKLSASIAHPQHIVDKVEEVEEEEQVEDVDWFKGKVHKKD